MKEYSFYKENNRWYIDLPEWEGSKDDLEMVCGADTMLDILSGGSNRVALTISTAPIPEYTDVLMLVRELDTSGATYTLINQDIEVWLCDVTKWLFGHFPDEIYLKKQSQK